MATSKPISTISYNTLPFVKDKLEQLRKNGFIQCYMYIVHKGEDGDKDHIHLRIEPSKRLDLNELSTFFVEPVPDNDLPLGVRPWRPSKEEDWFLYALHWEPYMKVKYPDDPHEKLPYEDKDIIVSPMYDREIAILRAKASLKHSSANILSQLESGFKPTELVRQGENATTVRTVQMILSQYRNKQEFDKMERSFLIESHKTTQLVNFVCSLGYKVEFDKEGELTIEKIYDNIEKGEITYEK